MGGGGVISDRVWWVRGSLVIGCGGWVGEGVTSDRVWWVGEGVTSDRVWWVGEGSLVIECGG